MTSLLDFNYSNSKPFSRDHNLSLRRKLTRQVIELCKAERSRLEKTEEQFLFCRSVDEIDSLYDQFIQEQEDFNRKKSVIIRFIFNIDLLLGVIFPDTDSGNTLNHLGYTSAFDVFAFVDQFSDPILDNLKEEFERYHDNITLVTGMYFIADAMEEELTGYRTRSRKRYLESRGKKHPFPLKDSRVISI